MSEQVALNVRQRQLLPAGSAVLVAVSGGVDSMVLLHVLHSLAAEQGRGLVVAHFDHGLRGAASTGDARFVERAARRLGLECVVERGAVQALARERGWSVEMAARELRHEFLARTAKRRGLGTVALAHHADDQVELFFLRLLRGAGGGLAGMKWRSPSPADLAITLIRPFLDQPKVALLEFAREQKIHFREDATNASEDILRNRVRRELLPLLRDRYASGCERTILRTMAIVGAETEFVQAAARDWLGKKRRTPFADLSIAVQRQAICFELVRLGLAADFELVERLRLEPGVKYSWQEGWLVREVAGTVEFQRAESPVALSEPLPLALDAKPGTVEYDGVKVVWHIRRHQTTAGATRRTEGQERFDAGLVGSPIVLRHWRPGDRFQPIGMALTVKLQDLFTNAKVPTRERPGRLVAEAADGRIFWVEGLRIAEPFKLSQSTRVQLEWRWHRPR
ncbi:MAG: tRNA lysidine(34) synthetase TilS [Proteobacteria bacterium]|nr:tRNA lysidine(34) synthetase TilS [Pseudomonadota bacterium]